MRWLELRRSKSRLECNLLCDRFQPDLKVVVAGRYSVIIEV